MVQKIVNVTVIAPMARHLAGHVGEGSLVYVHPRTMETALQEWFHFVPVPLERWLVWE